MNLGDAILHHASLVILLGALSNVACSSAGESPPPMGVMGVNTDQPHGIESSDPAPCEEGSRRYCTIRHEFSAVVWCLDGSELCRDGVWMECEAEEGSEAYETLSPEPAR